MRRLEYKHSGNFNYEVINKPFFGPWENAYKSLSKAEIAPMSEDKYLDYFKSIYPEIYSSIEWVRFYSFTCNWRHKRFNGFKFRLAVTYMKPNPKMRDYLFDIRNEITQNTGWYPLVMGSKAFKSKMIHYNSYNINQNLSNINIGHFCKIINVSKDYEGNSLLIEGTNGDILLDVGYEVDCDKIKDLKLLCLSHFHKDHSAGIVDILNKYDVPILLSETTYAYLNSLTEVGYEEKIKLKERSCIINSEIKNLSNSTISSIFPVFHCPGAYGFRFTDGDNCSLYYLGDMCLKNGYLNYKDTIIQLIENDNCLNKWVIVDSALVGKKDVSICVDDEPKLVFDNIKSNVKKRNIVFLSNSVETLIYSYIYIFNTTRNYNGDSVKIVISDELYNLLKTLWYSVIFKEYELLDPFVFNIIGKTKSDFIESQRLYPLSSLEQINPEENIILFITTENLSQKDLLKGRLKRSDIFLSGTLALREDIPIEISQARPRTIQRVASPDWSFHTNEIDLIQLVEKLSQEGTRCILFHNYPKTLRKFITNNNFNNMIYVNSKEGVSLYDF